MFICTAGDGLPSSCQDSGTHPNGHIIRELQVETEHLYTHNFSSITGTTETHFQSQIYSETISPPAPLRLPHPYVRQLPRQAPMPRRRDRRRVSGRSPTHRSRRAVAHHMSLRIVVTMDHSIHACLSWSWANPQNIHLHTARYVAKCARIAEGI